MTNVQVYQEKARSMREYLSHDHITKQFDAIVPKWLSAERLIRVFLGEALRNPKILDCDMPSVLMALARCAQYGLEPVLGKAALIPYKDKLEMQPMYRGLMDIARRSGMVGKITAHVVYEKDEFEFSYGLDETLRHVPYVPKCDKDGEPLDDAGSPIGAYTVWSLKDGEKTFLYMPKSEIYKIRNRSAAWKAYVKYDKTCPWVTDESEMMIKTVIKRHSKLQPASVEYMGAVEYDNLHEVGKELPAVPLIIDGSFPPGLEPTPLSFDSTIPEGTDTDRLNKFLALCVKNVGAPLDEVKAEAAKDPDSFWPQYQKWAESQGSPDNTVKTLYEEAKSLRKPGYADFVHKNTARIKEASQEDQDKLQAKWIEFYDEAWPLVVQDDLNAKVITMATQDDWVALGLVPGCEKIDGNNIPATKCRGCDAQMDSDGVMCPALADKLGGYEIPA